METAFVSNVKAGFMVTHCPIHGIVTVQHIANDEHNNKVYYCHADDVVDPMLDYEHTFVK